MPYNFVEGIVSDTAFEATGSSWSELFKSSAQALLSIMYDPSSTSTDKTMGIELEAENIERLLYDFLSELIFIIETEDVFIADVRVEVSGNRLSAELGVEQASQERLECIAKGISMHNFSVSKEGNNYKATVTVDV